jgi:hypothetical protein
VGAAAGCRANMLHRLWQHLDNKGQHRGTSPAYAQIQA